jgi:hypothetical protein
METSEVFCLVTDLLDVKEYPALDLACCYPDRWGCETVIGHHKTDMREGQPVLRSKDPRGRDAGNAGAVRRLPGHLPARRHRRERGWHLPGKDQLPARLAAATDTGAAFSADQQDLALATFLPKILMPGFAARDRPDRASPGKPGKPATSPPASAASPASPAESSSTGSTPG